jgi:hypothetical protein
VEDAAGWEGVAEVGGDVDVAADSIEHLIGEHAVDRGVDRAFDAV